MLKTGTSYIRGASYIRDKTVVKLIYDSFISSTDSFPEKTYQKWKTIIRVTISQDNFLEYFAAMYSCTTATKLREF